MQERTPARDQLRVVISQPSLEQQISHLASSLEALLGSPNIRIATRFCCFLPFSLILK
jgi:hypothetical protein